MIVDLPELDDGLDPWDGFVKMVDAPGFFELKRTRSEAPNPPAEAVLGDEP